MTKNWPSEEVRTTSEAIWDRVRPSSTHAENLCRASLMLTAFAERIEADERAVPFGYVSRNVAPFRTGTLAWQFSLAKVEPHGCIEAMPLFTHPPAQAAQVEVIGTLEPLVRELETMTAPDVVLKQITLLGKFAEASRKLIFEAMRASTAEPVAIKVKS